MRISTGLALVSILGLASVGLAGCADQPYDPDAPAIDPDAPRVRIVTPERGTILGDVGEVTVTGRAIDDVGVASVTVNGVAAAVAADGSFEVTVPVGVGTTLLHAEAADLDGNAGAATRAVVAGPMAPLATDVPDALTAALSAQTFDAIGRAAAGYVTTADLTALVAPLNPVVDAGAPNGPDCLYVQGDVTRVGVDDATFALVPQAGGLRLDAELVGVDVGMRLDYAAACNDGGRDITIAASRIRVTGVLAVGVTDGEFDISLDDVDVTITGLDVDLGGIPGAVVDLLDLDAAIGGVIAWAVERFAVPMLDEQLAALNQTMTIDVLGTPVDVRVRPARIRFDDTGAIVELDSSLRAQGDDAGPGYVFVRNAPPAMSTASGFALAVADDAASQLLASYWAAGGLTRGFDLDTTEYGEIGTLFDRVELAAAVPPSVDASGDALVLTIGDLIATFQNAGSTVTVVAINAQVAVQVTTDDDGALRLDAGTPVVHVDVDDVDVDGANVLANSELEAITSFALSRVVAVASGTLGAVPLPTIGGVEVRDVGVAPASGYVLVTGALD